MQTKWNISLFHYRNHGAGEKFSYPEDSRSADPARHPDIGKVLAGIQVPPEDDGDFDDMLKQLGYTFVEETDNAVYKRHLRS